MKKIFNPSEFSSQPESIRVSRMMPFSKEIIWNELIAYEDMTHWLPGLTQVHVSKNKDGNKGVGCKRVCTFNGEKLNEEIVLYEESEKYGYKIADNNLITDHVAYVTLKSVNDNLTQVEWVQHLKPNAGYLKALLMKKIFFPRVLKQGLNNLEKRIAA